MSHTTPTSNKDEIEETTITLPVSVIETLPLPVASQLGTSHGSFDSLHSLDAVSVGRSDSFPCAKRSGRMDQVVLKVVQKPLTT